MTDEADVDETNDNCGFTAEHLKKLKQVRYLSEKTLAALSHRLNTPIRI